MMEMRLMVGPVIDMEGDEKASIAGRSPGSQKMPWEGNPNVTVATES